MRHPPHHRRTDFPLYDVVTYVVFALTLLIAILAAVGRDFLDLKGHPRILNHNKDDPQCLQVPNCNARFWLQQQSLD